MELMDGVTNSAAPQSRAERIDCPVRAGRREADYV